MIFEDRFFIENGDITTACELKRKFSELDNTAKLPDKYSRQSCSIKLYANTKVAIVW